MKAIPFRVIDGKKEMCSPADATHILFKLPCAYVGLSYLPIQIKGTRAGTGNWSWNGDTEKVTVKPSLVTRWYSGAPNHDDPSENMAGSCHCWINDGKVQFLGDSTHLHESEIMDILDVTEGML